MGLKKQLSKIFSKKSKEGLPTEPAPRSLPPATPLVEWQNGSHSPERVSSPAEVLRHVPLSGLDKLSVVLNPPRPDPHRALAGSRTRSISHEARAATKIQAAYRGHLVRRSVRTHKSLVKVQALVRGHIVRRQATITLRCMNALVRVQARARANAVRRSATGREVQERLEAVGYRQAEVPEKRRTDGWVSSAAPVNALAADYHRKQTGFIKRERARAYAASFQKWKHAPAPKTVTYIPNDPDHEGWGWGWLERWMVARPWRNRSFIDATDRTRKDWAPPRKVVSINGDHGGPTVRRASDGGLLPSKVVDREEPNLESLLGEQRTCKWCGRLSTRVKDTDAGPLCGVCQLNTATATRLNKDPYSQTGTKPPKQEPVFPGKVVEWEEPNLEKEVGQQRTCKWCGRLSTRVKDTDAGPLCGVCQLNTATATRLNKDPYSQTGTKTDISFLGGAPSKERSTTGARRPPSPARTPTKVERRQSFPLSPKVVAPSPTAGTPKSVLSPHGTPRFMLPTQSSLPKARLGMPSPRTKPALPVDKKLAPAEEERGPLTNGHHDPQACNSGGAGAAEGLMECPLAMPGSDEGNDASSSSTPQRSWPTSPGAEHLEGPLDTPAASRTFDMRVPEDLAHNSQAAGNGASPAWPTSTDVPLAAQ